MLHSIYYGNDIFTETFPQQPTLLGFFIMLVIDTILYFGIAYLAELTLSGVQKFINLQKNKSNAY